MRLLVARAWCFAFGHMPRQYCEPVPHYEVRCRRCGEIESGGPPAALEDALYTDDDGEVLRSLPTDLRRRGWMVAVHNDYRLRGEFYTFWLFTRGDRFVKGEGRTDLEALDRIRAQLLGDDG